MYTVTTTFHSGKVKVTKVTQDQMTLNVMQTLEVMAMNGYNNVASVEIKDSNGTVVMYGEN